MKPKRQLVLFSLFLTLFLVGVVLVSPLVSHARPQGGNLCADGSAPVDGRCPIQNPAEGYLVSFDNFGALLKRVVEILLQFAGAIAVIFLVVGGYQYVVSRGNEEEMETAKRTIKSAIVGIVIISLAFAVVQIIDNLITRGTTGT